VQARHDPREPHLKTAAMAGDENVLPNDPAQQRQKEVPKGEDKPKKGEDGASGSKRAASRNVMVFCNAGEYGGGRAFDFQLDASGCRSLDEVAVLIRRGFALPSTKAVQVVTVSGEAVTLDVLHAPTDDLRLVLRIDDVLANFRMERTRCNVPVKGFLDDLASCQYTLLSALCELVDNSVQATRRNGRPLEREIQIVMKVAHADPACRSVVITDNGEGFDSAASEEFATLGMRGEASRAGDSLGEGLSNAGTFKGYFSAVLSRFGMGCKMAMNLIGDHYSLRTKTRGSPVVLEASYDKFGDEYTYTERHVPCDAGDEDKSWAVITVSGLQEGITGSFPILHSQHNRLSNVLKFCSDAGASAGNDVLCLHDSADLETDKQCFSVPNSGVSDEPRRQMATHSCPQPPLPLLLPSRTLGRRRRARWQPQIC